MRAAVSPDLGVERGLEVEAEDGRLRLRFDRFANACHTDGQGEYQNPKHRLC
jgi:hypothetical protein